MVAISCGRSRGPQRFFIYRSGSCRKVRRARRKSFDIDPTFLGTKIQCHRYQRKTRMTQPLKIYLADLTYDTIALSTEVFPQRRLCWRLRTGAVWDPRRCPSLQVHRGPRQSLESKSPGCPGPEQLLLEPTRRARDVQ